MTVTTEAKKSLLIPTPIERAKGRFMRAPDHDAGTADVVDPGGDDAAAPDNVEGGEDTTLMGDAGKTDDTAKEPANDGDKADDNADDKDAGGDDDKEAAQLPETYAIMLPDGEKVDETLLAEADPIFREAKLNQEQVDKLTPLVGKLQKATADRLIASQTENHGRMAADWAKEAKSAPDIGGDKWATTEANMGRALDMAGHNLPTITRTVDGKAVEVTGAEQVSEFRQLLNQSKLGNHPALIRMFAFYGSRIGEDNDFIRADGGAQVKPSREAARFPQHANNEGTN